MSVEATISELRDELELCDPHGTTSALSLLNRIERELKATFWPEGVYEVLLIHFGASIQNPKGRTRMALDRRIRHAMGKWHQRYGPLNSEQEQYAARVICSAINSAADGAGDDQLYPFVLKKLERIANHEVVHAGMKRRAGLVDVSAQLEGLL